MADNLTAGVKLINPENVISKLADRALLAKGRECSLLTDIICMLRAEPAAKPAQRERCEHCRYAIYTDKPFTVTTQMGYHVEVPFNYCPVCGNPIGVDEHEEGI